MRTVTLIALLVLGINALPELDPQIVSERQERIIEGQVINAIENLSQDIKDMGLDPLLIEHESFEYELPVPALFNAAAEVQDVRSFGLSDIVVENVNSILILNRIDFHIVLPHIHFFTRKAKGQVSSFGEKLDVEEGDGSVDIRNINVVGRANFRVSGIITGNLISSLTLDLTIGSIRSNIRLAINGQNYSEEVNGLISVKIPAILDEFSDEINELLEIILLPIINDNL